MNMKQLGKWLMAATLFCSLTTLTSCDEDERDNPVDYGVGQDVIRNREEILSHVKSDAKVLTENMNPEMLNLTTQVYSQLMELMVKDRNYMKNMKQVLAMMASSNALMNIKPVTYGSELAKLGYLMYIPVDIQTFGAQVVFDQNGNSRLFPCDGLEFIFPATVDGLGTTLYKVAFKAADNWYETIAPAQLKGVRGLACVYRVPGTITMTLSGFFDNKVVILSDASFDISNTQVSGQVSTSLKGTSYGLPDVESTLDFELGSIEDGKMSLDFGYINNGRHILNMTAVMSTPGTASPMDLLSGFDISGVSADVDMQILDDLRLYGSISDAASFAQAFSSGNADIFNLYSKLYLTCQHATQPLVLRMMAGQSDANVFMPAIWSYEHFELIPFDKLMGKSDVENVNQAFSMIVPPVSANMVSCMQLFSRIMKMLPLNSAEWGI